MELQRRFFEPPDRASSCFGPRGTGKSTWLRQTLPDALFLDLLQPDVARELAARPEWLRDILRAPRERRTVVIDEVRRVPELLNVVHAVIESDEPRRFALTGSSARKLRRGGVDLLAGRAVVRTLHPFMASELDQFDFPAALSRGLLPLVVAAEQPNDVLRAYASLYLDEEVRLEGWARNVGLCTLPGGDELLPRGRAQYRQRGARVPGRAKDGGGIRRGPGGLAARFPCARFARRAKREMSAHPKFYFFDAGVFRSLRPRGPLDRPEEIEGAALEGLVAQHLRAWLAYRGDDASLHFWRTRSGASRSTSSSMVLIPSWRLRSRTRHGSAPKIFAASMRSALEYPEAQLLLLYRGAIRERRDRTWILPVEDFLRALDPKQASAFGG